jgi:hypothetical protein
MKPAWVRFCTVLRSSSCLLLTPFRLHKLQVKDGQRAQLAQRAQNMSAQEDEDLGWDDLDPDGDEEPEAIPQDTEVSQGQQEEASFPVVSEPAAPKVMPAPSSLLPKTADVPETDAAGSMPAEASTSASATADVPIEAPVGGQASDEAASSMAPSEPLGLHPETEDAKTPPPAAPAPKTPSVMAEASDSSKDWSLVSSPSKTADAQIESSSLDKGSSSPTKPAVAQSKPRNAGQAKAVAKGTPTEGDEDLDWGNWD